MFSQWLEQIAKKASASALNPTADERAANLTANIERVSAALLVEVARSDHELAPQELETIHSALQQSSALEDEEVSSIINAAVSEVDVAVSFHEHIRLVNEQFGQAEKRLLIEQMWRVAAADGNVDHYEDYTIRKISELIHVRHAEFIKAKLRVLSD